MARFKNGWIKIERRMVLGDIGSSYIRSGLFNAIVAFANLQQSTVDWNGKPRNLHRGEMVTSLHELATLGDVDAKTVSKHLKYLVARGTIKLETCPNGTFIKILNFDRYYPLDAEGSTRHPHGMDDTVHTPWIHIEELKNNKESIGPVSEKNPSQSKSKRSEEVTFENEKELFLSLPEKTKTRWLRLYNDNQKYIDREIIKAFEYYENHPRKQPKTIRGWISALSSWFEKGWAREVKGSSQGPSRPSQSVPGVRSHL